MPAKVVSLNTPSLCTGIDKPCCLEHVPKLVAQNANLTALYSRSQRFVDSLLETAKSLNYDVAKIKIYTDEKPETNLDALLSRSDVTAVCIALPLLVQPDMVRKCLAAGKHVPWAQPAADRPSTPTSALSTYASNSVSSLTSTSSTRTWPTAPRKSGSARIATPAWPTTSTPPMES